MNGLHELLNASYKSNDKSTNELLKHGYSKDNSLSGKRTQVYKDEATGKGVVVHRGTQGWKDIGTDLYVSLGGDIKKTDRYKHSKKITDQARNKYTTISNVGHSLGGKLAETTANKNDKVITYNKAAVLSDIGKRRQKNQTDIRHKKDVVSFISKTQRGGKTKTVNNRTSNFISAHNTNNLKNVVYA